MFFVNAFDFNAMINKAIPADARTGLEMDDFLRGTRQGLELQISAIKSFKFLRVAQLDGQPCALLRVITTNGAVNYQDVFLEHDTNGAVRIDDVYIYLTGEKMSETVRRLIIPILQQNNESGLERLFGDSPDLIKYASQWRDMIYDVNHGRYQEGIEVYSQLPVSLQGEKFMLVEEMRAAQNVSRAKYLEAIELWRKRYPTDASVDLVSIDYYIYLKQYTEALELIDRLDQNVGGDPYLDQTRAGVYSLMKDSTNAEKYARSAVEREPDLITAGFFAIKLAMERQDFESCTQILEQMHAKGGYPKSALDSGLRASHVFLPLLRTDAYRDWYFAVPAGQPPELVPMDVPARGTN